VILSYYFGKRRARDFELLVCFGENILGASSNDLGPFVFPSIFHD